MALIDCVTIRDHLVTSVGECDYTGTKGLGLSVSIDATVRGITCTRDVFLSLTVCEALESGKLTKDELAYYFF